MIYISLLFIGFLIYFIATSHFSRIDSIPIGIESLIIISFSFYYLYEQMRNPTNLFIYNNYIFWILIGIVMYLAGSFFIYIYGEQLDTAEWRKYRYLTLVFYNLRGIFFAISILVFIKNRNRYATTPKNVPFLDLT